ncbi:mitochondrial protein Pet127-domain-containing protein [Amylostereum chailletii]|nr:mitochondrial protein Pet127-domain-containing protein [Amylostereum chailletii]
MLPRSLLAAASNSSRRRLLHVKHRDHELPPPPTLNGRNSDSSDLPHSSRTSMGTKEKPEKARNARARPGKRRSRKVDIQPPSEKRKTKRTVEESGFPVFRRPSAQDDEESSPRREKKLPNYSHRIQGVIPPSPHPVLRDLSPPSPQRPIATLAHGLERTLFNPGVNWMQDPRSGVYNFDPWISTVPSVKDFAFERIPGFISSAQDRDLWTLAKREGKMFAGSTSSLTGLLSQVYFLLSQDKEVDLSNLSRHFINEPATFTPGQRMPVSVELKYQDGVYAVVKTGLIADESESNVLTWMGTLLEKFFTTSQKEFSRFDRSSDNPATPPTDGLREAYRYTKSEHFVMRSQLDGHDPRLPGSGVFDIKTRAALPVRLDRMNHDMYSGYLINHLHGSNNSFEYEYYDLIRSAFLKYSIQARIGGMDGVLVAYHNTARVFGFQYITLEDMDKCLYGAAKRGPPVFRKCVEILERVLLEAVAAFPKQSVQILMEKVEGRNPLRLYIQPVNELKESDTAASHSEPKVPKYMVDLQDMFKNADSRLQSKEAEDPSFEEKAFSGSDVSSVGEDVRSAKMDAEEDTERAMARFTLPPAPGPLKMIEVNLSNYVKSKFVLGNEAIEAAGANKGDWTVQYSIATSSLPDERLRFLFDSARMRQFRTYLLPTGVSVEEMEERWPQYMFHQQSPRPLPDFNPKLWDQPSLRVLKLRRMAEHGLEYTRKWAERDVERAKEVPSWVERDDALDSVERSVGEKDAKRSVGKKDAKASATPSS